jgi:hypothetical protein
METIGLDKRQITILDKQTNKQTEIDAIVNEIQKSKTILNY